jgi:hypothetical protein
MVVIRCVGVSLLHQFIGRPSFLFLKYFIIIDIIPSIGLVMTFIIYSLRAASLTLSPSSVCAGGAQVWKRLFAPPCSTHFSSLDYELRKTSLIGTVVCNAVLRLKVRASGRAEE